jgi:hypothetical protein
VEKRKPPEVFPEMADLTMRKECPEKSRLSCPPAARRGTNSLDQASQHQWLAETVDGKSTSAPE